MTDSNNPRRVAPPPQRVPTQRPQLRPNPQRNIRRKRRKSNMSLYYIMVAIIVGLAFYFLSNFVFFRLDEIAITGSTYYSRENIISASTLREGDNLFRTDIKGIEERLNMMMVYADEVTVRRKLPSKIEITVKEAKPKYNLEQDGVYYLVSESGKILETNLLEPKKGLVVVNGFDIKNKNPNAKLESKDVLKAKILDEITSQIETMKFEKINRINLTDRTDIKLYYDNRIVIQIGSSLDIPYKLRYTRAVLDAVKKNYGEEFEGDLIYHSATSGMSAISAKNGNQSVIKPDNVENIHDDEENHGG